MNEPVPMSSFGMITNQCSQQFCRDKDGLELWLSLLKDCFVNTALMIETEEKILFSPYYTAFICASTAYLFFVFGYILRLKVIEL